MVNECYLYVSPWVQGDGYREIPVSCVSMVIMCYPGYWETSSIIIKLGTCVVNGQWYVHSLRCGKTSLNHEVVHLCGKCV